MSALVWVGLTFVGLCLVGTLAWLISAGNRMDDRVVDLDDDW